MNVEPGMYFYLEGIGGNQGTNVSITKVTIKICGFYNFSFPHTIRIPIFEKEGNYIVVFDLLGTFSLHIRNVVTSSFRSNLSSFERLEVTERILEEL
jgi:hypothetical protein